MRTVLWTDENGYKHRSLVRDNDPDELAAEGLNQDPPSVHALDWESIKRTIHNSLVDRELFTWSDVIRQQDGVSGAILAGIRRPLIALYKRR